MNTVVSVEFGAIDRLRILQNSIFSWDDEIAFLEDQPGYYPEVGRQHRAAKRRLADEWIRELEAEFKALHYAGLVILVHSDVSRPDLAKELWRLKRRFSLLIWLLKLRLCFRSSAIRDIASLSTCFLERLGGYVSIIQHDCPRPSV